MFKLKLTGIEVGECHAEEQPRVTFFGWTRFFKWANIRRLLIGCGACAKRVFRKKVSEDDSFDSEAEAKRDKQVDKLKQKVSHPILL